MVSPGMKKRAEQLVARAGELARAGNREKALLALQRAAELDPENEQIQKSIAELEREQAAMRNFSKSRSARAHTNIGQATPADFVSECMKRSDEALSEGDEVRALQELERAKRHDPENIDVNRKIQILRRQIKVNGLFDKAVARLASGEPAEAVAAARRIFEMWSMAPSLPELVSRIEAWTPAGAPKRETAPVRKTRQAPAAAAVSPETAAVASIRDRIAKSAYMEAYQEALEASSKYPGNTTIRDLITGLEKLLGKTAPVVSEPEEAPAPAPAVKRTRKAAPVPEPVIEPAREEPREPEGRKKFPVWIVVAAVLAVLAVLILVFKPFGPPEPVEPVGVQPYTVSFTVPGVAEPHVSLDGVELHPDPATGVYSFTDTLSTPRTVEVRVIGYETLFQTFQPEPGSVSEMELAPDTLGTHTVTVAFSPVMPAGEPDPEPGQIAWMVDGAQVSTPLEIPTGLHVFQPVMEGFNSIPESILVDFSPEVQNFTLALLSRQESQIVLTLAADVPGTANFDIDGERVGSGVRRVSEVLPLGTHTIRVTMENREPWAETVNLTEAGYTRTVAPVEIILTGRLLIGPEPWANVTVNGESRGQTPMPPLELPEGTYTVRLTNPDYEDQVSTVTITAGEDTSIRYTAQPVSPEEITSPADEPVIPPFPISQTSPVTPSLALQRGDVHGFVTLEVRVGTDGRVRDVSVINDQVGLGCGQAAIDAVRQWVFNPATQGGSPVEVTTTVQVRFDVD